MLDKARLSKSSNILNLTWPVTSSVTPRSTKLDFPRQILSIYRTPIFLFFIFYIYILYIYIFILFILLYFYIIYILFIYLYILYILKCPAKSLIFGFIMGVNWDLFRSALNGVWFKWKTTDAILFPHMKSTLKSCWHRALRLAIHPNLDTEQRSSRKFIQLAVPSGKCGFAQAPDLPSEASGNGPEARADAVVD